MNLANMAAGPAPWIASGPLATGADLSLQLGFALAGPVEAPAAVPAAWSWTNEPRDSARHGAELAALLVILQPVENDFLPLEAEAAPPLPAEMPLLPTAPPSHAWGEPEAWMIAPPMEQPLPEWPML